MQFRKKREKIIIPEWLFDERKRFTIRHPYSIANKKSSKLFRNKIEDFTNAAIKLIVIWNKRKIQSLVKYKDEVKQQNCVIYRSVIYIL